MTREEKIELLIQNFKQMTPESKEKFIAYIRTMTAEECNKAD